MTKLSSVLRKVGLPVLMIGTVLYGTANLSTIVSGYSSLLGKGSDPSVSMFETTYGKFKEWSPNGVPTPELVKLLDESPGWVKLSQKNMKLIQGLWTEDPTSKEAVQLVYKTTNVSVGLFNLEQLRGFYEYVSANDYNKTITVILRVTEVGK
jgi:hypothetical protein